ncbi:DUF6348 family protein [Spirillospora sp. NPDC052269]
MSEISATGLAGLLARLLAEGHHIAAEHDGDAVDLPEHGLRVVVGAPDLQSNGMVVRVPIGVVMPEWGGVAAWDQAVGIGGGDRSPAMDALDGWLHNVFPVFAAAYVPGSDLTGHVHPYAMSNGTQTADVYFGPLAMRDFGGMTDAVRETAAELPPTMRAVHTLLDGYAYPDRPIWAYTFCGNMPDGPVTEVTVLNDDASASMAHIADHLPWDGGHGSVKSWALVVPAKGEHVAATSGENAAPAGGEKVVPAGGED